MIVGCDDSSEITGLISGQILFVKPEQSFMVDAVCDGVLLFTACAGRIGFEVQGEAFHEPLRSVRGTTVHSAVESNLMAGFVCQRGACECGDPNEVICLCCIPAGIRCRGQDCLFGRR